MTRRILVTGGSGFIGTNVVQHVVDHDAGAVRNLDRVAPRNPEHRQWWHAADLRDAAAVREVVREFAPTQIVHLGARTDLTGTTAADYDVNTTGVENVIDSARSCATVERVVFASTQLVCTPGYRPTSDLDFCPPNLYGESKVVGEGIVRDRAADAFTWVILRPTSIWGPWAVPRDRAFFRAVRRGLYVHPRGVRVRKSFGFVGNAAHQVARILDAPPAAIHGRVVYLADYEPYPVYEWATLIQREMGAPPVREVPASVLGLLARGGDLLQRVGVKEPPLTSYRLRNLMLETTFDMEPLRELCGPLPHDLPDATRLTVRWMRAHPED